MIQTNRLTERFEIQKLIVSANTYGAPIDIWQSVRIVNGTILSQRGNQNFNGAYQGDVYSDNLSLYFRYLPNISKKDTRLFHIKTQQVYEPINITHVSRNQATVIDCISVK